MQDPPASKQSAQRAVTSAVENALAVGCEIKTIADAVLLPLESHYSCSDVRYAFNKANMHERCGGRGGSSSSGGGGSDSEKREDALHLRIMGF